HPPGPCRNEYLRRQGSIERFRHFFVLSQQFPDRMNQYRPAFQFSFFPPVIKNLLIINVLVYLAEVVAMQTGAVQLAVILNAMALYPPGSGEIGYSIFGAS